MTEPAKCRSCGAPIIWALTPAGRRIPVDAEPVERGNLHLDQHGARPIVVPATPGDGDWVSHFATCPDAPDWRKR